MTASRLPGRPRDPAHEQALLNAVISLLTEIGYRALTVDRVAEAAGVAKTTLYRRWPSKEALVLDAIAHHLGRRDPPHTGDPLADLRTLVAMVYQQLSDPVTGRALPLLDAELADRPELASQYRQRFIEPLRTHALRLLDQAVATGQLAPLADPDLIVDALAALAIYRPLARGIPATQADGLALVDLILHSYQPGQRPVLG